MKKFTAIISFVFAMLQHENLFSQNVKSVDYYAAKDSLVGLFPFDQGFQINVFDIPDSINSFEIKIWEIKKYDYKILLKEKYNKTKIKELSPGSTLTSKDIEEHKGAIIFSTGEFTRAGTNETKNTFSGNKAVVQIVYYLQPNSHYKISLIKYVKRELSDAEKDKLKDTIRNDKEIQRLVNETTAENILNPTSTAKKWPDIVRQLDNRAKELVQAVNENYKIKAIDFDKNLNRIAAAFIKDANLALKIKDINNRYDIEVFKRKNDTLEKNNSLLIDALKKTNWVTIKKGDAKDYQKIIKFLSAFIYTDTNKAIEANQFKKLQADSASVVTHLDSAIDNISKTLDDFTILEANNVIYAGSSSGKSYPAEYTQMAKQHITFDLGYAYVGGIDRGNAYAALNIYFRGIDTTLPLKNTRANFADFIGSRLSLLIGVSVQSIKKDSVRKGLLSDNMALVVGTGFRLLPWFKINTGAYLYYKYPTNPLYSKDRLTFTGSPFVAFSIDFNLNTFLKTFGNGAIGNNILQQ